VTGQELTAFMTVATDVVAEDLQPSLSREELTLLLSEESTLKNVVDVLGLVALVVSVGVLAWQTKISNDIAGATVLSTAMANDRDVDRVMLQFPGMRAYFYERKPCPRRGRERERLLILTAMYADVLEGGLMATRRVPASESYEDWRSYSRYILDHSPTMFSFVQEHPDWFPILAGLCEELQPRPTQATGRTVRLALALVAISALATSRWRKSFWPR
jgi:hypothetical protein